MSQTIYLFNILKEIAREAERETTPVPFSKILERMKDKGYSEDEIEEVIHKLKRSGDLYEPKPGFLKLV